ncbi:LysR family transcriptional regulator [Amaricoccus solimangrovi]|uniref:LysR family transcriptional regulator n=1 Tax=Amaricoccus solimangrovi TaxID=2589815 RepID=A0A501WJX4_9RHOB|nr:LysR family transcriptional regulator [Amaricoccus solimangrovi]TPE50163.1 LysR family transcriptional regulator [Amaricoccus solimangrovi]
MPLRFTLRQLEYLLAVGEAGGVTQAAERVNVSAPSISTAIAQVEAEFGLPLFIRKHAHGLTPTGAGRAFLAQARRVITAAEELHAMANDLSDTVRGPLAVGCLVTFAQLVLPELRRRFEDRYAGVAVRQHELNHAEIIERLRVANLDIGLTYDLGVPGDIVFEPLAELPPFVMLSPDDPLARAEALRPEDLVDHGMVLLDLPHSGDYFLSIFGRFGLRPRIAERTRDMSVARAMVANGFGYTVVTARARHDLAPDGKPLAFVPLAGLAPLSLGIALSRAAHRTATVEAFLEHCRALVRAEGVPGLWHDRGNPP